MTKYNPQRPPRTNPAQAPLSNQPPVRRRKPSPWWKNIKYIVFGILILLLAVFFVERYLKYWDLDQEMTRVEQQQQQLEAEQRALEAEKAKYNDPKAVEKEAREQLGLVKPNEVPYIR
ncbi:MAG: cell division protein FtsL [Negativicoccus succinicivorans]|uniref:FtsB family cell division protein n=1 Tax=Negativicoccus succinicivorans TaxID=620903 RepID=UPI0026EA1A8C|nr:cell division protein FtsL [Negativicoccus succinicivorans]MBS6028665.1 cell division protein FtsL [Negativicoccus succinicivorans]